MITIAHSMNLPSIRTQTVLEIDHEHGGVLQSVSHTVIR